VSQPQNEAAKNPRRILAGRRNGALRGPLSEAGRQRLRAAALLGRPWRWARGPRSAAGKRRAAANGKLRQTDALSVREVRVQVAAVRQLITLLRETRPSC
jgi:hypothetical protein